MKKFKGSIVIGDPSYFIKNEDDWERCEYGSNLAVLGFTDYLYLDFPDDPQIVINSDTGEVLGGICQDSLWYTNPNLKNTILTTKKTSARLTVWITTALSLRILTVKLTVKKCRLKPNSVGILKL